MLNIWTKVVKRARRDSESRLQGEGHEAMNPVEEVQVLQQQGAQRESERTDDVDRLDPNQWFRDDASALNLPLWWRLTQQAELVEALRSVCTGATPVVQLRTWVFLEPLASYESGSPSSTLSFTRDDSRQRATKGCTR